MRLNVATMTIGIIPANEAAALIKAYKNGWYIFGIYCGQSPTDMIYLYTDDYRHFYYCQDRLYYKTTFSDTWYMMKPGTKGY